MPAGVTGGVARVFMTADAVGGVWSYAVDLARGFSAREIETTIAVVGPSASGEKRRQLAAIPGVEMVDTGLPLDWTAGSRAELVEGNAALADLVERLRPDIVHLNAPALAAETDYPAPMVAVAHSCVATWWRAMRSERMPEDFAWRGAAVRQGLEQADIVVAASRAFGGALRDVHGTDFPLAIVPNGRAPVGLIGEKQHHVFAAGRLWDEAKNVALLDRVARRLPAPIFVAGSVRGPNGAQAEFRHLAALGVLSDEQMARHHAQALIFASPARYEPFGLAVLEAAQAGAALVLSDIPSFREMWEGASVLLPPGDDAAWADTLRSLLDAPNRAACLGAAARERSRAYALDAMIEGTLGVYRDVLGRGAG
jgi:glycosyltransferase involved in cell wall biosynthesis